MTSYPIADARAYAARLARDTGATLYAIGRTRREAQHRLIIALESRYRRQYAEEQAITANTLTHPED